ncbi:putative ribonuclease H-like domain-containing protein [Tanacetum coccineum]
MTLTLCKSKLASVPAGIGIRQHPVPADRSDPAASRNRPAGDPSTDNDIGIVDSGCSRSMTGNKEKLDDFVQIKGGIVKFEVEMNSNCLMQSAVLRILGNIISTHSTSPPAKPDKRSIDQKYYSLVVTDDFSRFSWTFFLSTKDETFYVLKEFITLIENQLNKKVKGIRCDNGTEFKNAKLIELCGKKGIKRDYSNPRTPQQNGDSEPLIESAETMVSITNPHNKTPYELISGKVPQISHLKPFGCQVTILNTSDYLGKFEGKADDGYLVGLQSFIQQMVLATAEIPFKAEAEIRNQGVFLLFKILLALISAVKDSSGVDLLFGNAVAIVCLLKVVEPADESNPAVSSSVSADLNSVYADESTLPTLVNQLGTKLKTTTLYSPPAVEVNLVPTKRVNTIHPQSQILGDLASPVLTRSRAHKSKFGESAFIGYVQDQQRINHTDQLHCLSACFLSQLEPTSIAKALEDPDWVDANARKRFNILSNQQSAFLYGKLKKEVNVTQPKGFEDPYFPNMVNRVVKALNRHSSSTLEPACVMNLSFTDLDLSSCDASEYLHACAHLAHSTLNSYFTQTILLMQLFLLSTLKSISNSNYRDAANLERQRSSYTINYTERSVSNTFMTLTT